MKTIKKNKYWILLPNIFISNLNAPLRQRYICQLCFFRFVSVFTDLFQELKSVVGKKETLTAVVNSMKQNGLKLWHIVG
jgi:hypothetical protein